MTATRLPGQQGMTATRLPGQRAGLTRDAIIGTARELLAEGGRRGLTMRAVAKRIGVSPNALYSYFADKDALIDALIDDVLAAVRLADDAGADPVDAVRQIIGSTYSVLLYNAELVPLFVERQGARGPNAQELGRVVRELLARAGVGGAAASDALHVLVVHAIGSAAFATGAPIPTDQDAAHAAQRFERGLRWLLDGISG